MKTAVFDLMPARVRRSLGKLGADIALGRRKRGGLRPKCTVVDDEGRLSIGKFPSVADERAVTKGEVLALRLAADAGIKPRRRNWFTAAGHRSR